MEKIVWTDRARNEELLHRVKGERNIVRTMERRQANWFGRFLRRNCLLIHIIEEKIEGRIEMTMRRGRRCKHLLDDFRETRGYRKLKEDALDRPLWLSRFARDY